MTHLLKDELLILLDNDRMCKKYGYTVKSECGNLPSGFENPCGWKVMLIPTENFMIGLRALIHSVHAINSGISISLSTMDGCYLMFL